MTKLTYEADVRVYVRRETWENEGATSQFFVGVYTVALNSHVRIAFVPDVSDVCPPWREDLVPNGAEVSSEREARLFQVLTSEYSVTPNSRLAGREEVIQLPSGNPPPDLDPWGAELSGPNHGTIWYVALDDWQALADELEELTESAYSEVHFVRMSQIAGTHLAKFLVERFLSSGRLPASHLEILRRA
jgi:hypothetical protein